MSLLEYQLRRFSSLGVAFAFILYFGATWEVFVVGAEPVESSVQWSELSVDPSARVGFRRIESSDSQVRFVNHLAEESAERNRILENGSGVAAGDVDGDGRVDLYFCRLEGDNALYRNLGEFR